MSTLTFDRELTYEERVQAYMHLLKVDEIEARAIIAIEQGESDGDVIILKPGENPA